MWCHTQLDVFVAGVDTGEAADSTRAVPRKALLAAGQAVGWSMQDWAGKGVGTGAGRTAAAAVRTAVVRGCLWLVWPAMVHSSRGLALQRPLWGTPA